MSYSHQDKDQVARLAQALDHYGYTVYYDAALRPGEAFAAALNTQISQAKVVLVLWTPAAATSAWVAREARWALAKGTYLPLWIDGGTPPEDLADHHAPRLADWDLTKIGGALVDRLGPPGMTSLERLRTEVLGRSPGAPLPSVSRHLPIGQNLRAWIAEEAARHPDDGDRSLLPPGLREEAERLQAHKPKRRAFLARVGRTERAPDIRSLDLSASARLSLAPGQVPDGIEALHLKGVPIHDLGTLPLGLRELFLQDTPVVDLGPLAAQSALEGLHLAGTPVRDLAPLAACPVLNWLNLRDTGVTDLSPLRACHWLGGLILPDGRHIGSMRRADENDQIAAVKAFLDGRGPRQETR